MGDTKWVSYTEFIDRIATDFNLSLEKEFRLKLPTDKKTMRRFITSVAYKTRIFDGTNEHPYMLPTRRNDEALATGIELRYTGRKSFGEVLDESGAEVKSCSVKMCEGGGWYSAGTKYTYKEIYIEL
jgi:hypothetical protein